MNNWIQKTLIQEKVNFYFHTDNPFMHMLKMLHLQFYYCTDNGTRFSEVVIFLNVFSECHGVFVTDSEMNDNKDKYLLFIYFHHHEDDSFPLSIRNSYLIMKNILCELI